MAMRMFPGNTEGPLFGTLRERIHKFVHHRVDTVARARRKLQFYVVFTKRVPTAVFPRFAIIRIYLLRP